MKKTIIIIVSILFGLIAIYLGYRAIQIFNYKRAVKNNDCNKIYDMIYKEEGTYLLKSKYINACAANLPNHKNEKIEYQNHKIKNKLVNILKNIKIYVPNDSDLYLDEKIVDLDFAYDDSKLYKIYTFDKLYEGNYKLSIRNKVSDYFENIDISQDNQEIKLEYDNDKVVISVLLLDDSCIYCTKLMDYLDTLDHNIFDVKKYETTLYKNTQEQENFISFSMKFKNVFGKETNGFPIAVIGDEYIDGFTDVYIEGSMPNYKQKYLDLIYKAYRNKIKNVIE